MTATISLWETYLIETILSKGMSATTLLEYLKREDSKSLNDLDDTYDYTELVEASKKDFATIEQAITSGYTIKYVSKYGIKNLLGLKFQLQEGKDYQMVENKFLGITLPHEQIKTLETMVVRQWKLINKQTMEDKKVQVDIVHVTEV